MSGTEGRSSWQAAFAPPPPPPLEPEPIADASTGPASLADDAAPAPPVDDEPERATEARHARRLSAVPEEGRRTERPAAPVADADAPAEPATRSEREQASALIAAIGDAGIDGALVGVRRSPSGPTFDVELGTVEAVQAVVLLAQDLEVALGAEQVRVARREGDALVVRIDVLRAESVEDRGRQMAVWVPVEVRDGVEREKARTDETFTEYFLGAFNRQYLRLDSFFPRRVATAGPMPQKRSRRRRGIATPVQLWLYLNREQREVLDDAVERSGAGSRSALVTKVLEADLGLPGATR